ncbi:hypothetical protein GCM10009733_034820 [Nonomuraea maheshkhaliensis]|uniref:Alpha/beta hydrolase n=1 Tax=Nonomuraea maheshkhaliensis TaxID=419590 RepID=A0ABN2F830_9ACTN
MGVPPPASRVARTTPPISATTADADMMPTAQPGGFDVAGRVLPPSGQYDAGGTGGPVVIFAPWVGRHRDWGEI